VKDVYGSVDVVFNNVGILLLDDDFIFDIGIEVWWCV